MVEKKVFLNIAPAGWVFILPPLVLGLIGLGLAWTVTGAVLLVVAGYMAFFFRDPDRVPPEGEDVAVSPADGKVLYVDEVDHPGFPEGRAVRVGIMLTIFNVHVNRAVLGGTVASIKYCPGKFHNALFDKCSELNEHNRIGFSGKFGYSEVRQIAGLIARRIVCYTREGETLARGQRIGLIRFGSRAEAYLPLGTEIWIRKGDHVRAGASALGRVNAKAAQS